MGVEGVEGLEGGVGKDGDGAVTSGQEEVSGWRGMVERYLVCLESLLDGRSGCGARGSGDWDQKVVLVESLSALFHVEPTDLPGVSIPSSQP